jgi:hypothetical protein
MVPKTLTLSTMMDRLSINDITIFDSRSKFHYLMCFSLRFVSRWETSWRIPALLAGLLLDKRPALLAGLFIL